MGNQLGSSRKRVPIPPSLLKLKLNLTPEQQELCDEVMKTAAEVLELNASPGDNTVASAQAFANLERILKELELHARHGNTSTLPIETPSLINQFTRSITDEDSVNLQRSSILRTDIDTQHVKPVKAAHTNYDKIATVMAQYSFDATRIAVSCVAGPSCESPRQLNIENWSNPKPNFPEPIKTNWEESNRSDETFPSDREEDFFTAPESDTSS